MTVSRACNTIIAASAIGSLALLLLERYLTTLDKAQR